LNVAHRDLANCYDTVIEPIPESRLVSPRAEKVFVTDCNTQKVIQFANQK